MGYRTRQREKITMRIPQQVTERVKEAPAQALRAVFSGIGQVLLVADRIKNRAAVPDRARSLAATPTPESAQSSQGTATVVKDETRWRSLDQTGNVRLLSGEDVTPGQPSAEAVTVAAPAETVPAAEDIPAAQTVAPAETVPAAETAPSAQTAAERSVHDKTSLPVPNYDELTVASLRARLRNLDPSQVRTLLDYEKANAGRAAVLTMFERRIAKLESGEA
jgi:hypothetical protein